MSYNITNVEVVFLDAYMLASDIVDVFNKFGDDLPERNFIADHLEVAKQKMKTSEARVSCRSCKGKNEHDAMFCKKCGKKLPLRKDEKPIIKLQSFQFSGAGSRQSEQVLEKIASFITGTVELVVLWENGDTYTGIMIKDGKYTTCGVEFRLIKPKGW